MVLRICKNICHHSMSLAYWQFWNIQSIIHRVFKKIIFVILNIAKQFQSNNWYWLLNHCTTITITNYVNFTFLVIFIFTNLFLYPLVLNGLPTFYQSQFLFSFPFHYISYHFIINFKFYNLIGRENKTECFS